MSAEFLGFDMSPPVPHRSQVTPLTIWTVALHLLAIAAVIVLVRRASLVVSWALIAGFLALAFEPAVAWLLGRGLKRGPAVLVVFGVAVGVGGLLVATVVPMLVEQARGLVGNAPALLERFETSRVGAWLARFDVVDRARDELGQLGPDAAASVFGVVAGVFQGVIGFVTITVLTVFMLLFGSRVFRGAMAWLPPQNRAHTLDLTQRMKKAVGGYVAGTLLIASIGGVVTAIGTLLLGVPYFLPLGLMMALLGVIPFIGSTIGAVLVVGTTLVTVGVKAAVIALVAYLVYQQVENQLLHPLIQRRTIKMNPLIIILVMLAGTALFGVLGALLALPVAGALQVLLQDRLASRRAGWGEDVAEPAVPPDEDEAPSADPALAPAT